MAYGTFTLTGTHQDITTGPHAGKVVIAPNAVIRDSVGNVILSGAKEVTLDTLGHWSVVLPADDPTLSPSTGLGYRVTYRLHSSSLPPAFVAAQPAGTTLDVSDIPTSVTPVAAPEVAVTTTTLPGLIDAMGGAGSGGGFVVSDAPTKPVDGKSTTYWVTSAVVWPSGLVWSDDPDLNVAPTITSAALVSLITVGATTYGVAGATFTVPVAADTTAPSVPTGLTATATSSTTVDLSWTASTDAVGVTGYEYRVGGGTVVNAGVGTTETVSGLTASTLYSFEVRAYDAAGNRSAWSTAASATTQAPPSDTTAPTAGTLAGSAITATGFTLTVTGATDETALHATPYRFSTDNGATYSAYQAGATYNATGLTASTGYTCKHQVRDAAGNVATGTSVVVTTAASAPPATLEYVTTVGSSSNLASYTFAGVSLGVAAAAREIVALIHTFDGTSDPTVSGVTIGGVAATIDTAAAQTNRRVTVARATVPTGTTGDIVVTMTAAAQRCGIGVYRSAAPLAVTSTQWNGNQNGATSLSITPVTNGSLVAMAAIQNASGVVCDWTGGPLENQETELDTGSFPGRFSSALLTPTTATAYTVSATWTPSATNLYGILVAVAYQGV